MKADRRRKRGLSRIACKFLSVMTLFFFCSGYVFAMPSGQQVVNGQATFAAQGNTLTITNSPSAIIHWQGFSIGSNEIVRFIQQYGSSAVLNRVVGQDPSRILGLLQSNGRVFLVNPNGILFGAGARIDVNGLVASTLNMSNQDFMAGRYNFSAGEFAGSIKNEGSITTPAGGKVYLIAPDIENSGLIHSPKGDVVLAAGRKVELVDSFDPNISVVVSAPEDRTVNLGQIIAESGRVGIYGGLISQKGVVSADRAVAGEDGRIFFKASREAALEAGSVTSAQGGGKIEVLADMKEGRVAVNGAIDTSAPEGGDGGFIETSAAKVTVGDQASVSALAPYGKTGTWLIDPTNYTIAATGGDISGAALGNQLATANVTIATESEGTDPGNIAVDDSVSWTGTNTLTLRAHNDVIVNRPISALMGGKLVLRADLDSNGAGTVVFGGAVGAGGGSVTMSPGYGSTATIFYNPTDGYANPTDYSGYFSGALPLAYMLVNNVNDLQNMNTNLTGFYALGKNIDASATSGWNSGGGFSPVGESGDIYFNGRFNGDGHTISGLYINRPNATSWIGLFGYNSGIIENVGLAGGSITGYDNVGGLAGQNEGSIENSYNTATVTGTGGQVGGLVGNNSTGGFIGNSYNAGTVSAAGSHIGGLAGRNTGAISNTYNTGSVSGSVAVGGLVGYNGSSVSGGSIAHSYSSGAVSGTSEVGGLVGREISGTTDSSFWDVNTSGQIISAAGTGLTTAEMMTQSTFTGESPNWDFTNTWWMSDSNTRPFLRSEYSTTINNAHQFQLVLMDLAGNYTQAEDIVMGELKQASGMWDASKGFVPLGNDNLSQPAGNIFTGSYNGAGHTIADMFIYRPATNYVGPFGGCGAATIMNLGMINVDVTGYFQVGGLAAHTGGLIANSFTTGKVTGISNTVGGLVGLSAGNTVQCYSTADVQGATYVGGLMGSLYSGTGSAGGATIINSYSTGSVTGNSSVGGLLGNNFNQGTAPNVISNSFWNTQTSGQTTSAGGTGKTTAEMRSQATYTGWDFVNTWQITEGASYPTLRYQTAVAPPVQQQTISGMFDAGAGKTIFFAVNGALLPETATTGAGGVFSVALDLGTVAAGDALLAYLGGDTVKSAYVFLSAGGNIANLNLDSNTVTAGSGGGSISNATLGTAKGGLATDIPYNFFATNNELSLAAGIHFKTAAGTNYALSGNITTAGGSQTFNGPVTLNTGNILLDAGAGNINFAGGVAGGTFSLILNSTGSVMQGGPITVGALALLGPGGTYNLTHAGNTVQTLAADTGTVQFTSNAGFGIGTVNATAGLTASGDLTIKAGGSISQTAPIKVAGAAVLDVGAAQSITLTDTGNDFNSVGLVGGVVSLKDANNVTLHASTIGTDLNAMADGDIVLGGLVNAGAGRVTLNAGGAIVNGLGGATSILADVLDATALNGIGSGDPLMTAVHKLSAANFAANNIEIDNTGALAVDTLVNNATTGNVALQNIGAVTTDAATVLSGGTVSIVAHSPLTIGAGGVTANDTVTLEASPSGGADNLTINGDITSNFGDINLTAGSSIVVGPAIALNAPNGTITMTEGLNGTQTGTLAAAANAAATSTTVSSLVTAMAKITSEENGDGEDELEKKSQEGGQQPTDGGARTDEGKNYCN